MTKEREALKQALEALELLAGRPTEVALDYADNAITAIKEALAQPESPPKNETLHPAMDMPHDQKIAFAYGLGNGER